MNFPLPFTKMSGAGNDFIVVDNRNLFLDDTQKEKLAVQVCRRRFSVGGDGIIFIEKSAGYDFKWDFYNSDGSVAEMCGNGARCAARYAFEKDIAERKMAFETIAGIIHAEVFEDDSVRLEMTEPFDFQSCDPIEFGGSTKEVNFVNTGVPHAVVFVDDLEAPVHEWGPLVRYHEQFQPAGTNANFVSALAEGKFSSRTYERGVEEETRACGTGAVASALYASLLGKANSPITIVTSGGEELIISFELEGGPSAKNVMMQGPARIVYEGKLTAETLG